MGTVAELTVQEELAFISEVAESRNWNLRLIDKLHFMLSLPASDGTVYHLYVECDDYPGRPAAWHWSNADGGGRQDGSSAPAGSGFLHPNGVICAPWNRLSYSSVDPRGPHGDWSISDWRNNSRTMGCKTLCAMALRIHVELNGPNFHKRRLAA